MATAFRKRGMEGKKRERERREREGKKECVAKIK